MKKLNTIKSNTMFLKFLQVENLTALHPVMMNLGRGDMVGASMGLVNVLSGTGVLRKEPSQKPISGSKVSQWAGHILLSSLLLLTSLIANAQTNWAARSQQALADVAYGAGKYVAVGDYGLIRTSSDGMAWNAQVNETTQSQSLTSVIYANGRFVAVGYEGRILTSTDGLTWTKRASGTTKALTAVTFGNGKYVAVGFNGAILTSLDATTWALMSSNPADTYLDVVAGPNMFVAVGSNGVVKTSVTGSGWTARSIPVSGVDLRSITVGKNGEYFAVGSLSVVVSSKDGLTWKYHAVAPANMMLSGVAYNSASGQYVAVSLESNKVVASTDGVTWKPYATIVNTSLTSVRYIQGHFLATGYGNAIFSSPDGYSSWDHITINQEIDLYGAAFGNGRFVAVGEFVADYNRALAANAAVTSTDGINYSVGNTVKVAGGHARKFFNVAFGKGLFVAVGEDAIIQTSTDGKVWTSQKMILGKTLKSIAFGNGWFVAVGLDNLVMRSMDGKNWMQTTTGFSMESNGITFAQGRFMAVGMSGGIASSTDGLIWTNLKVNTPKQFKSIAYGNGLWVAVGYEGLGAWSLNGYTWYLYTFGWTDFNQVIFANGQFVAVANAAKIFTSPTGTGWTQRQSNTSIYYHFNSVVFANGLFSAVGTIGSVATSKADTKAGSARLQLTEPTYSTETNELTLNTTGGDGTDIEFMALDSTGWTSTAVQAIDAKLHEAKAGKPLILMARQGDQETYYVWDISAISAPEKPEPVFQEKSEVKSKFKAVAFPVPVQDQMTITIDDAAGQKVRIQLIDLTGRTVVDKTVDVAENHYEETMPMAQRQTGLYILRLATSKHMQAIKVMKQ
jgi:photosystem II stability/assembly factor-like uncharacterized protein